MAFLWLGIRAVIDELLPSAGQPSPRIVAERWDRLQKLNKKINRLTGFAVLYSTVSSTNRDLVFDIMHDEFHKVFERDGKVILDVAIDVAKASRIVGNDQIADMILKHHKEIVGASDEKANSSDWKE
jgi:hypothetical protein